MNTGINVGTKSRTSYSKLVIDAKHASLMRLNTVSLFATNKASLCILLSNSVVLKSCIACLERGKSSVTKANNNKKRRIFFSLM